MQKHITLSQLTNAIYGTLAERFKSAMWVVAEVSECKRNSSGHFYLSLVERQEGSNLPVAELKGAIWAQNYRRISEHFYSISGCNIQSGMKLLFRCTLSYHSNYGLSLIISDIDPTYTLGEGERMRQLTIAKLQSQGVWDLQKEQNTMPRVIQRLAVISSATAAGYEDFCKQLDSSKYRFEVDLYEAMMQGEQTQSTIIKALERILSSEREYDSVIIIRGGGSASDLRWFDSYDLAFYIAQFPMPILTGIGHEKDISVADMVAFHSFKTPTAVASTLIERIAVLDNRLESLRGEIINLAQQKILGESQRTNTVAQNLKSRTIEILQHEALKLEALKGAVPSLSRSIIDRQLNRVSSLRGESISLAQQKIAIESRRTNLIAQGLRARTVETLQHEALKLEGLKGAVPSLSQAIIEKQKSRMAMASKVIPQIATGIIERQLGRVGALRGSFLQNAQHLLHTSEQRVSSAYHSLRNITNIRMQSCAMQLQQLSNRIPTSAETIVQRESYRIERLQSYLGQQSSYLVSSRRGQLENLQSSFLRQATNLLQREESKLNILEERVASNNPRRILAQGYSLVFDSKGEIIKSVEGLNCGDTLNLELMDGVARTKIESLDLRK